MSLRLLPLGLATILALAGPVAAEVTPGRGSHDHRVRVARFVDGEVYRVNVSLTHVTTVEFGPGETIRSIIAGDTEGFDFDAVPGGRAFAIKPVMRGVATNITVYTNQRSYYFSVQELGDSTHYVVRFAYPEARRARPAAVAAGAPNSHYGASAQTEFTPVAVWDDGTFTWFRFDANAPMPAIFRHANGRERTVNATPQGDGLLRVSGLSREWVLRLGEELVCIEALESTAP